MYKLKLFAFSMIILGASLLAGSILLFSGQVIDLIIGVLLNGY